MSPEPPTSIVTIFGLLHSSIVIISSTCSVFSLLSHFNEPQVPISEDSMSRIDSTIFAPVASAIFSISEESNSPTVNIELSDNRYNISLSISPVQNTVLAPLLIIAFAIDSLRSCSASTNESS